MSEQLVIDLGRQAIITAIKVATPMLGLGLVTGLAISIFQATTQINEQTLTFIPKILAVLLGAVIFGPWMLQVLIDFTAGVFDQIPYLIR